MQANTFPDETRVWVYQSSRELSTSDANIIRAKAKNFVESWVSHNQALRANADVLHNRFLILMVDESQAGASGCSIDKSVAFVQSLGTEYQSDFFNRMLFSFKNAEGQVQTVDQNAFKELYSNGSINDETIVFDPLVKTKGELDAGLEKHLAKSWHKRFV